MTSTHDGLRDDLRSPAPPAHALIARIPHTHRYVIALQRFRTVFFRGVYAWFFDRAWPLGWSLSSPLRASLPEAFEKLDHNNDRRCTKYPPYPI